MTSPRPPFTPRARHRAAITHAAAFWLGVLFAAMVLAI